MISTRRSAQLGLASALMILAGSMGILVAKTLEVSSHTSLSIGATITELQLPDLDGRWNQINTANGKVTVLCFTSPRSPLCNLYIDDLSDLTKQFGDNSLVQFVNINTLNSKDPLELAEARLQSKLFAEGMKAVLDSDGNVGRMFAIESRPGLCVLDGNGNLHFRDILGNNPDEKNIQLGNCSKVIQQLLNGRPEPLAVYTHAFGSAQR